MENNDNDGMEEAICNICGRPILIMQTSDPTQPIIVDGDRSGKKEDGSLVIYRHTCKKC